VGPPGSQPALGQLNAPSAPPTHSSSCAAPALGNRCTPRTLPAASAAAWAGTDGPAAPSAGKEGFFSRAHPEVHVPLPTDKLSCKRAAPPPRTPCVLVSCGSFNPPTGAPPLTTARPCGPPPPGPPPPMLGPRLQASPPEPARRRAALTRPPTPPPPLPPPPPSPAVAHMRMFDLASQALVDQGHDVWGCYMSPVNDGYGKQQLAPVQHRLEMCRLAAEEAPGVMVDCWEARQRGYVSAPAPACATHLPGPGPTASAARRPAPSAASRLCASARSARSLPMAVRRTCCTPQRRPAGAPALTAPGAAAGAHAERAAARGGAPAAAGGARRRRRRRSCCCCCRRCAAAGRRRCRSRCSSSCRRQRRWLRQPLRRGRRRR
jgi:hypothetical protein